MAFPAGWPPRVPTSVRSIRVYKTGTATAAYSANAYLFSQITSANTFQPTPYVPPGQEAAAPGWAATAVPSPPMGGGQNANDSSADPRNIVPPPPVPMIWSKVIKVTNSDMSNVLFLSFDGVNDQGQVQPNTVAYYWDRYEAGIAFKGNGAFILEAW